MWESQNEDLEKLKTFLLDNNIKLEYSSDSENYIDYSTDTITIACNQTPKHVVYTILHELGHYFLDTHFDESNKTTIVIEEVLAWDRGYDIGQTLQIDIDDEVWKSLVEDSIREYIEQ
jgi:hypothetical protein